jgi:Domain of unknown function (DUF4160)
VIWPFDHDPPPVHARQGTPNTPSARRSRFEIATGNVIDQPSPAGLPAAKARQVKEWISEHRDELSPNGSNYSRDARPRATDRRDRAQTRARRARVLHRRRGPRRRPQPHTRKPPFSELRNPDTFAKARIGQVTGGSNGAGMVVKGADMSPRSTLPAHRSSTRSSRYRGTDPDQGHAPIRCAARSCGSCATKEPYRSRARRWRTDAQDELKDGRG